MDVHIAKYQNMDGKKANNNRLADPMLQQPSNNQNTIMEQFQVEDRKSLSRGIPQVSNQAPKEEEFIDKVKRIYHDISTNRSVRAVFCPFDDSSEECQICYKICVVVTLLIIIFMFYLISVYN